MKTETIINLIFDANRGSVSQLSREGVYGEPYGQLPIPTRRGYTFCGWYHGDEPVNADTVIDTEEDIRLVAHWQKDAAATDKKQSMLKRQKTAIAILAVVSVVLIITFVIVAQLIAIYSFYDTYTVDGVEHSDKYYVKRHDGVYKLFDEDGNLMETNGVSDTIFIARKSGNQYKIDPDTGEHTLRAMVDAEDGEFAAGSILLIFPQLLSNTIYSIEMENKQDGKYMLYRTSEGVEIKDFESANLELDSDLFTKLCFSCGYMISNRKISASSSDPMIPRLADGTIDYAVYGLDDPQATYTVQGILYKKNADGSDLYQNGAYVIDYDASGNPQPDPNKRYTIHIGDEILSGAGYYVRLEGRESVYIVTTDYIADTILQPLESLVVPRVVFPVSVTYHSMGKDFLLGYLPEWDKADKLETIVSFTYSELDERINTMDSTRPYLTDGVMPGYYINDNSAMELFGLFYSIQSIACRHIGINEDALKKFHLDKDVYYLTYKTDSGNVDENGQKLYVTNELFISQKQEQGTYYVAAVPFDMIVEVDQYYLSFLEWDYIKWYSTAFIFHNISYVRDMTFEFNGQAFDMAEDKVYSFTLDNLMSYAYYINENNELKAVDLSMGKIYFENGKNVYKTNGKSYDVTAIVNLDTIEVVSHKDVILDSTLSNVAYVPETYYYVNSNGENVGVSLNYTTRTIEYEGGCYYYVDSVKNERIRVYRSLGDPVYRYKQGMEATLGIGAKGLLVSCNGELLEYNISNSGMGDAGVTEYDTVTASDNYRQLHMQVLQFSLMGDVDPVEFLADKGMTVEEFLATADKAPIAKISAHVEDYARVLNGYTYYDKDGNLVKHYTENNSIYVEYKFYQYTGQKVLVTVELFKENEQGEFVSQSPDGVVGKFYAAKGKLGELLLDIERLLNGELIDSSVKY